MAIDLDRIFARGGKELIDVLNYCVRSVQMDPVFLFLVMEYRLAPTASRAVALYDMFVSVGAPARIDGGDLLPPRDLGLQNLIQGLRRVSAAVASPANPGIAPGKFIFDNLSGYLGTNRRGAIARIKRRYNPKLGPNENLPGGKMTSGQKQFVDQVWQPRVRPALVRAGFRRMANIA
jgi:hypothetical protein